MAMELGQPGLKTLYRMQILTERTDEEHALNAAEIADILEHTYQVENNQADALYGDQEADRFRHGHCHEDR